MTNKTDKEIIEKILREVNSDICTKDGKIIFNKNRGLTSMEKIIGKRVIEKTLLMKDGEKDILYKCPLCKIPMKHQKEIHTFVCKKCFYREWYPYRQGDDILQVKQRTDEILKLIEKWADNLHLHKFNNDELQELCQEILALEEKK